MSALAAIDRALLMRCPMQFAVPVQRRHASSETLRQEAQISRLLRDKLVRVEWHEAASGATAVTRTIHLTDAGLAALNAGTPAR